MKVFNNSKDLREYLANYTSIGFVPTMGNLHDGHLSLLTQSIKENELSVVSIFVNPTQFSKEEDFSSYPRTIKQDIEKIKATKSTDVVVFIPESLSEVYPNDEKIYKVTGPTTILEGELRPTHFDAVTTVVYHLFKIVEPTAAYFGQKDYQQLVLIKRLNEQYHLNIKIIGLPTVRQDDGLAMSSRNGYLTQQQKKEALVLRSTLICIKDIYKQSKSIKEVNQYIKNITDSRFNYLELREKDTLAPINELTKSFVVLGNFQINNTKLLDNLEFE